MCVENHRNIVTIGDMLTENCEEVRVVNGPSMPQTLFLRDLLPPGDLGLKGPQGTQYKLVDLPARIARGNCFDIYKDITDTVVSIEIGNDPIEGLTFLYLENNTTQSVRDILSNGPDLSHVGIP